MSEEYGMGRVLLTRVVASRWQPRGAVFDEERLWGLACSIREQGLINAVVVFPVRIGIGEEEPTGQYYELVAGERRMRAIMGLAWAKMDKEVTAREAIGMLAREGLAVVPAEVRELLDAARTEIEARVEPEEDLGRLHQVAVVENLERESLSPLEEAQALHDLAQEYSWSQRELGRKVGKSQSYIAARFSLLGLVDEVREAVNTRVLSATHARAIARVPRVLQPAVTAWATSAVGKSDSPATSRQVQNRARQVAAFVDPDRWVPNKETTYRPTTRNRLAMMRWVLEGADLAQCSSALLVLAEEGYNHSNWLAKKPIDLVRSEYGFGAAVGALERSSVSACWREFASETGRTCGTCVLSTVAGEVPHCDLGRDSAGTCQGHIGHDDPLVIPLGHDLVHWFGELEIEFKTEPFEHVTLVAPYVTGYGMAQARKEERQRQEKERKSTKHVVEIQAYMEWQAQRSEEELAHFQAHACSKCVNYRDDLTCRFAVEPLTSRYNKSSLRSPEFGVLVSEDGRMLPRCEQFAYREIPKLPKIIGNERMRFGRRKQAVEWLCALAMHRNFYANCTWIWGTLRFLDYGRPLDKATDYDRLKRWLKNNWDELGGDGAIATLLDVVLSEARASASRETFKLLNPIANQVEQFAAVDWRVIIGEVTYLYGYPAGWARPWENAGENTDSVAGKGGGE